MTSGIFTVLAFTGFILIAIWAWSRSNRTRFDEAARLPLDDEAPRSCCRGSTDRTEGGRRP